MLRHIPKHRVVFYENRRMQNGEVPSSSKEFRNAFCERFNCRRPEFEGKVFWRCLYPHAVPIAKLIMLVDSDYFQEDFEAIRHLGNASTVADVLAEVNSLHDNYRAHSKFFREVLRIRISGKRLLRLAQKLVL